MSNLEQSLKNIIISVSKKDVTSEEINYSTNLINDLSFNSVLIIDMIMKLEIEFDFELEEEDMDFEVLSNFNTLVELIARKQNAKSH